MDFLYSEIFKLLEAYVTKRLVLLLRARLPTRQLRRPPGGHGVRKRPQKQCKKIK